MTPACSALARSLAVFEAHSHVLRRAEGGQIDGKDGSYCIVRTYRDGKAVTRTRQSRVPGKSACATHGEVGECG